MLANFLRKSKPINFIILLSFFFCYFLLIVYTNFFIDGFNIEELLKSGVLFLLFLGVFFFYNFIISKNSLTLDNFYAFFLFLLFLSFLLKNLIEYKDLIILLLHLVFLRKAYSLKSIKQVLKKVFDAGFWLGISFLMNPFFVVFFILIYAGIFLHQKITIHTILSPIIGFLSPLIICFTYYFWFDNIEGFQQLFYFNTINDLSIYADNNIWFVGFVFLLTLISLFIKSPKILSVNNSFKRNWILLIINLILALFFTLVAKEKNDAEIVFLFFPTSIIIANGLEAINNNFVKNVIFILILIGAIFN